MVSIYLRTGEGLSAGNLGLLQKLKEVLTKHGRLWVCAGDFNMETEELMASFDLQELGALLVQPKEPTHEQGGKWRKLSYL